MNKILNNVGIYINNIFYTNKESLIKNILYYGAKGMLGLFNKFPSGVISIQYIYKKFFDYPKLLYIHPGTNCNLNCIYCYDREEREKKETRLKFENYKKIISDAKKLGVGQVHILGGEPFFYKDLYRLLDEINTNNLAVHLYSNGTMLNDKNIEKLKKYKDVLTISVSIEPENVYKEICGKDCYREVSKNILKAKKTGLRIGVLITVNKINIKYIKKLAEEFIIKNDILAIFERFLPIKNEEINSKLTISQSEWQYFLKLQNRIFRKLKNIPVGKITPLLRGYGCNDYYEAIHISGTGNISPCEYVLDRITIGNIKEESLRDLWEKYKKEREGWLKLPDECEKCKNSRVCGGGCKTFAYLTKGGFNHKDPLCSGKGFPFA